MSISKGMSAYDEKIRRQRRRNNEALKDLQTSKYRQRIKPAKKRRTWDDEYFEDGE